MQHVQKADRNPLFRSVRCSQGEWFAPARLKGTSKSKQHCVDGPPTAQRQSPHQIELRYGSRSISQSADCHHLPWKPTRTGYLGPRDAQPIAVGTSRTDPPDYSTPQGAAFARFLPVSSFTYTTARSPKRLRAVTASLRASYAVISLTILSGRMILIVLGT